MSDVKSADRKPEIWTDPNTGKKRIRMVPTDRKVVDKDAEWKVPVSEVSNDTLRSYGAKAKSSAIQSRQAALAATARGDKQDLKKNINTLNKRNKGLKALDKRLPHHPNESVTEAVDTNRVKQLGTLGLVDKKDVQRLMIIMKKLDDDKELNIREKNMVVNMFQQLISIVTGDVSVFAKTKKAVSEAREDEEPASPDEAGMAMSQLKFIGYAADEIMEYIQEGAAFPEWFQNKLTGTYESMKDLHAFMEGNEYEEEDDA